jgi:hypothetical protein
VDIAPQRPKAASSQEYDKPGKGPLDLLLPSSFIFSSESICQSPLLCSLAHHMFTDIDHENLLKNPLSIFENENSTTTLNISPTRHHIPHHSDEEEQHTSDEDQSEEDDETSVPIPEVLCNLKDIEVPIDNDILFEVDENDSIRISSPGTCTELKTGDM